MAVSGTRHSMLSRSLSLWPILCKIIFLVKLSLPITAATRLADADPFVIAEILGHSDLRITKGYTHATDQRKREALERLALYDKKLKSRWLLSPDLPHDCHNETT